MAKRTTTRPSGPIETKPTFGLSTNLVAGYIVTFVFATWPWIADRVPDDLKAQLPVILGTVLGALVAYYAPHTHRPDLAQPPPMARLVERPPPMQPPEEDPGPGRSGWPG
jgi:hypothetical protein